MWEGEAGTYENVVSIITKLLLIYIATIMITFNSLYLLYGLCKAGQTTFMFFIYYKVTYIWQATFISFVGEKSIKVSISGFGM